MYDEDLIEDSLAFAKEIKAFFQEDNNQASKTPESVLENIKTTVPKTPEVLTQTEQPIVPQLNKQQKAPVRQVVPKPQIKPTESNEETKTVVPSAAIPNQSGPEKLPVKQGTLQANVQQKTVQRQVAMQKPQIKKTEQNPSATENEISVADEAIQRLRAIRKAEAENLKEEDSTKGSEEIAAKAESVRELPKEGNHTYEITIKFDFENIKKRFQKLKDKLAPEPRTLEDVNAAMEENRQLKAEKENQEKKTIAENGSEIAQKAKSIVKKFPKIQFANPDKESKQDSDTIVDAEAVPVESSNIVDGKISSRLEDVKVSLPQKASFASHLVTNILILVFCVGIAYFFASFVTSYVAHQTTVEGESMEPTLSDGDTVIIQRLSYYFTSPDRYDVVVFPVTYDESADEDTYYIKRVIGLPGETVQIIDGSVYINGEKLQDDKYALSDILEAGVASDPLILGKDQYFVMGDNRNMSTDSRNSYVGLVNRKDIIGEAWICTWPLNHFGSLKR